MKRTLTIILSSLLLIGATITPLPHSADNLYCDGPTIQTSNRCWVETDYYWE